MIKNNRSVHINLSFNGKQIGFSPNETKNLKHLLTPIEELKLAKQFGLIFIPDANLQSTIGIKPAMSASEKKAEEKKVKILSQEQEAIDASTKAEVDHKVKMIKEQALKEHEERMENKVEGETVMEMTAQTFNEATDTNSTPKEKKSAIVEGKEDVVIEKSVDEVDEEIFLKKTEVATKKEKKKKVSKKK